MRVTLYQQVKPSDGSPTLPIGWYDVDALKWISRSGNTEAELASNGLATFIVITGPQASTVRRIGVVKVATEQPL